MLDKKVLEQEDKKFVLKQLEPIKAFMAQVQLEQKKLDILEKKLSSKEELEAIKAQLVSRKNMLDSQVCALETQLDNLESQSYKESGLFRLFHLNNSDNAISQGTQINTEILNSTSAEVVNSTLHEEGKSNPSPI